MKSPKQILIKNAVALQTMDEKLTEYSPGSILIEGNIIKKIGRKITAKADEVIDASGKVILPGLINTHHHLYQTFTRNVPGVQDVELFDWLKQLYEIWRGLTPEGVYVSALVGMGELLLTGCTTTSDHLYLFPKSAPGNLIDEEIRAAREIGIRFHATRGSMSRGVSKGGLPPDDTVQDEETILKDSQRLIEEYHDAKLFSMCRIALAPCSPFSVTTELLRDTAALARQYKVRLHTHLAETKDEEDYCLQMHGVRPLKYMEQVNWLGEDVWFAHAVFLNDGELQVMAETQTGVAHCPVSNLRLASGVCPVPRMLELGVPVGLGVDGSASNDSSDFLGEVRQCMLVHRVGSGVKTMPARRALEIATRGSAGILGRRDIGSLEEGKAADLIMIDMNKLGYAGAMHDPVAAVVFAGDSHIVDMTMVNGKIVVKNGKLVNVNELEIIKDANRLAGKMVKRAPRKVIPGKETKTSETLSKLKEYQAELEDILHTLKRIDLKLLQTQPYLKDFGKLVRKFNAPMIPLKGHPGVGVSIKDSIGQPYIRRELQKDYSTRIYLDAGQYLSCNDEILGEYLELAIRELGKNLQGMKPDLLLMKIETPQDHNMTVKVVGERIVLQLRERDLLKAQEELLKRLDEMVFDLYGVRPRTPNKAHGR